MTDKNTLEVLKRILRELRRLNDLIERLSEAHRSTYRGYYVPECVKYRVRIKNLNMDAYEHLREKLRKAVPEILKGT